MVTTSDQRSAISDERGAGVGRGDRRRGAFVRYGISASAVVASLLGGAPHARAALPLAFDPSSLVGRRSSLAPDPSSLVARRSSLSAPPRTFVLIVTGASGEPAYAQRFERVGAMLVDAFRERAGLPAAQVVWLAEEPARDARRIGGRSARAEVEAALARVAAQAREGDQLLLVLVGHGSNEGPESRFNLPGPDITAAELAKALDAVRGARVAVVNAASAGGDFVPVLAQRGRIVVSATKTAYERNETRFAEFFAQAYSADGADADKDGAVSLLEAFDFARTEVARLYERDRHLLTEHAVLDDDGDGSGSLTPGAQAADGRLASTFVVGGATAAAAASADPRVAALAAEKAVLERQVADLRARKAGMDSTAYERELERLLVALAEKTQALRAAEARKP
jgi:hypothetical protein